MQISTKKLDYFMQITALGKILNYLLKKFCKESISYILLFVMNNNFPIK
jgi:hypothetical protein